MFVSIDENAEDTYENEVSKARKRNPMDHLSIQVFFFFSKLVTHRSNLAFIALRCGSRGQLRGGVGKGLSKFSIPTDFPQTS